MIKYNKKTANKMPNIVVTTSENNFVNSGL